MYLLKYTIFAFMIGLSLFVAACNKKTVEPIIIYITTTPVPTQTDQSIKITPEFTTAAPTNAPALPTSTQFSTPSPSDVFNVPVENLPPFPTATPSATIPGVPSPTPIPNVPTIPPPSSDQLNVPPPDMLPILDR